MNNLIFIKTDELWSKTTKKKNDSKGLTRLQNRWLRNWHSDTIVECIEIKLVYLNNYRYDLFNYSPYL